MKTALTLTMLAFALAAERLHQTEPRDMPPEPEEHPTPEEYKAHWRGTTDIQTMNDTAQLDGLLALALASKSPKNSAAPQTPSRVITKSTNQRCPPTWLTP